MRLVYAGEPGTTHSEAYLRFLGELGETRFLDVAELATADLSDVDLLVVDADWRHEVPAGLTLDTLSMPTVLVGNFGVKAGDALHLKLGTNLGCMCLDEDAVVWDTTHPVFAGLESAVLEKPAPAHFLSDASRAIFDVRETLPTLRVLRDPVEKAGQVTSGLGFLDSPDCEVIAGGFNEKTQDHFAIGRQGRFLQWGFAGSPDDYTREGRVLLAACIRYLLPFKDDPVRALRTTLPRPALQFYLASESWRGVGLPQEIRALLEGGFLTRTFQGRAPAEILAERPDRLRWYADNRGFLRNDGQGWYADTEAQSLGIATDDTAFLDACLKAGDATLWERYTGRPLDEAWLDANRAHLYFTDWGGYRWASSAEDPVLLVPSAEHVALTPTVEIGAARYDDVVQCVMALQIAPGFHAYAPGATDGLPLLLTAGAGFEVHEDLQLFSEGEHVSGQVQARFALRGRGDVLDATLRVQLCDELTCQAPQTLSLQSEIREGIPA